MNHSHSNLNQQQIDWRREKVLQLASDGYGVREIAGVLKVSHPTISRDLQWLRAEAKQHIHEYITDQVPFEYKKTLAGLEGIVKQMSQIISKSTDNKEIMQASNIKMQALNMKMEMVSGANLVEEGIELVERYQGYTMEKGKVMIDDTSKTA